MKSIQAITILASIVAAFSASNEHVAQKDTEFERLYLAEYERDLGALIESKMDMSMSYGIQEALVEASSSSPASDLEYPHLTPPPTPGPGASMSYGSKGGKGSKKSGGGSMSYGGKGEKKSRCRTKGSKSSEAPSLSPSIDAKAEKVPTPPPTPSPTIFCGKGDKPSGGYGKGGKSGGSSMSYGGKGGKGGKSGGRSKGGKSSEAPSFMPSKPPSDSKAKKESSSSIPLRA